MITVNDDKKIITVVENVFLAQNCHLKIFGSDCIIK
jgi:hypothetical protein